MHVFPNPAHDRIEIQMDPALGLGIITLTDALGRALRTEHTNRDRVVLDVSGLAPGSYGVVFRGEAGTEVVRFVRE